MLHDAGHCRALLDGPADIVLIDAQLDRNGTLSSLAAQAHDFLIVTRVAAAAITEAYACMKRLHYAHAIGQFRVLVNHVQNAADARHRVRQTCRAWRAGISLWRSRRRAMSRRMRG